MTNCSNNSARRTAGPSRVGPAASRQTLIVGLILPLLGYVSVVRAESMSGALAKAYVYSPELNQQRAATRAVDENVPRAMAGWRPALSATSSIGSAKSSTVSQGLAAQEITSVPRVNSVSLTQTLYNGGRTGNSVRQAESTVMQSREALRQAEQDLLSSASTAYMNVLRDTALLDLQNNNLVVLHKQLSQTEERFQVGEVTKTDVAQAQAFLAQVEASAYQARFDLQNSIAIYRQLVGVQPRNLEPARALEGLLPGSLEAALATALKDHPRIQGAMNAIDAAASNVAVQEGALLPTVSATGLAQVSRDPSGYSNYQNKSYSVVASLSMPLYDGGATYSGVRQAKELLGQARMQLDLQREAIRSGVISAWGAFQTSKLTIRSLQAEVKANEIALEGTREEARVGQRTTLDILNAQQVLMSSRVSLVVAQRFRVVASYGLLAAMGKLSAATLSLGVASYDPTLHFDQVKDKWFGTDNSN